MYSRFSTETASSCSGRCTINALASGQFNRSLLGPNLAMLLLGALLAVMALASCRQEREARAAGQKPTQAAIKASVIELQGQQGQSYVELTGTLAGARSVSLSTKLMSQITMLGVVEGQRVSAGDVLVRIDDTDIQAMRNEAAAYRAEAAAALAEVDTVVAQGQAGKAQAEAAVSQAEAALADARRDLERTTTLVDAGVSPPVQKEKAELGLKMAEENLNKARSAVTQAEAAIEQAHSRTPQVEAKQLQASAKDQQAAALQDYSVLKAPFDGVVTKKYFEAGQLAIPGQPILSIDALGGYKVKLGIPEHLAGGLSPGTVLDVMVEESDGIARELTGSLIVLGAAADPASHLVNAELRLNSGTGLLSGQFVRVRVPAGERQQLLLPESSLLQDGEIYFVWRLASGDVASRVSIEVGERRDGKVEILRGLSPGDRVLDSPPAGLYPGARIEDKSGAAGRSVSDEPSASAASDGAVNDGGSK